MAATAAANLSMDAAVTLMDIGAFNFSTANYQLFAILMPVKTLFRYWNERKIGVMK